MSDGVERCSFCMKSSFGEHHTVFYWIVERSTEVDYTILDKSLPVNGIADLGAALFCRGGQARTRPIVRACPLTFS